MSADMVSLLFFVFLEMSLAAGRFQEPSQSPYSLRDVAQIK